MSGDGMRRTMSAQLCRLGMPFVLTALLLVEAAAQPVNAQRESAGEFQGKIRLLLPRVIYAVPGIQANVYFDNVTLVINPANYAFVVTCDKGTHQTERWTYTPASGDAGDYPFLLEARDESNAVVARARSTIHVSAPQARAGQALSLLCIGDSLTHAGVYPQHILDLCKAEGNPKIRLIGSFGPGATGPGELRHEGYGGWTAQRFATFYNNGVARTGDYTKRGSPFIYADANGQPKLDYARYCTEFNGGSGPDFVTIFLGCNDTFSAIDANIDAAIDGMFKHYDTLIKMIHGVRKETKIGAVLLVPPAGSQDAFGANYQCGQTRWQYKRNQHRVVEQMLKHYGGREGENLWLIPANVNLDCVHNYPQAAIPWNARSDEEVARLDNAVHPADSGYRQIGDSIYGWIKAQMAPGK
jgi:lysophospholipase L1-like esterase